MIGLIGEFRVGEDIALELEVASGDPAPVTAVIAAMKPAKITANRPILDEPPTPSPCRGPSRERLDGIAAEHHQRRAEPRIYGIDARLQSLAGSRSPSRPPSSP
jgi:hypothetical protein